MTFGPSLIVLPTDIRADAVAIFDTAGNQLSGFDSSRPATAVITTLPATNASQTLLAANAARRQVFITNEASKTAFIAFAGVASATSYTIALAGGQSVALPLNGYTGIITAILSAGTGNIRVTEVTT